VGSANKAQRALRGAKPTSVPKGFTIRWRIVIIAFERVRGVRHRGEEPISPKSKGEAGNRYHFRLSLVNSFLA